MVTDKRSFFVGLGMTVVFIVTLVTMFSPIFGGENAFHASDRMFNSIAKGSTHYIPELIEQNEAWRGTPLDMAIDLEDGPLAADMAVVLESAGVRVEIRGTKLMLLGDLGVLLAEALTDADDMFYNRGDQVTQRRNTEPRRALYLWYLALEGIEGELTGARQFDAARFVEEVSARGVEVGYNFHGIEPHSARSKAGILTLALLFYVAYTLWWGFTIYYLVAGLGLQLKGGAKKEV